MGVMRPKNNQRFATPQVGSLVVSVSPRPKSLTIFRAAEIGAKQAAGPSQFAE
jgi:hypothetical protein